MLTVLGNVFILGVSLYCLGLIGAVSGICFTDGIDARALPWIVRARTVSANYKAPWTNSKLCVDWTFWEC